MRSFYKQSALIATMILVASTPCAFATTASFPNYANFDTSYTRSSDDTSTGGVGGFGSLYSAPDGTNYGNSNLYLYGSASITAPDTATLSSVSANLNGVVMDLTAGGTYADANVEAYISDPTSSGCSPSYLCALSGVYSNLYSDVIYTGTGGTNPTAIYGGNTNYGISQTGTYYIVGYVETEVEPASCTSCVSYISGSPSGITNFHITITY